MQAIRLTKFILTALAAAAALSQRAAGADAEPNEATNAPTWAVEIKAESGPGIMPALRAHVTDGARRFAFLVPAGYRLEKSQPKRATLVSADYSRMLIFEIREAPPGGAPSLSSAACRATLTREHPGAKIQHEFQLSADCRQGPAFDAQWVAAGGVPRSGRVAFIPAEVGVLEFSLVSSSAQLGAGWDEFNTLLLTFRASDKHGNLVITPLSDKL